MSRQKIPPDDYVLFRAHAAEQPLSAAHARHKKKRAAPADKTTAKEKDKAPEPNTPSPRVVRQTPATDRSHNIATDQLRRIQKGKRPIDARLDLHGLTQEAAHATLLAFVQKAIDAKLRTLLVITGKGRQGQGVLRDNVPRWLAASPTLNKKIVGVAESGATHGGNGAFYIALVSQNKIPSS